MSLSSQLFPLPMLVARNAWVLIVIWIVVKETNLIYIPLIIDQTFSFMFPYSKICLIKFWNMPQIKNLLNNFKSYFNIIHWIYVWFQILPLCNNVNLLKSHCALFNMFVFNNLKVEMFLSLKKSTNEFEPSFDTMMQIHIEYIY